MQRIWRRIHSLATAVTIAAAGIAVLPGEHWPGDLFANLTLHIAGAGIALSLLGTAAWRAPVVLLPLIATLPALLALGSAVLELPAAQDRLDDTLTVVTYNVGLADPADAATLRYLGQQHADILVLQELSPAWMPFVRTLGDRYPHALTMPRRDNFGLAMLSRESPEHAASQHFAAGDIPFGVVTLSRGGRPLTVIGIHLEWPVFPDAHARRNAQIAELATIVRALDGTVVVCGDFNLTPYSRSYAGFLGDSGLSDIAGPARFAGTWPATLPGLRIPIDHCFAGAGAEVSRKSRGESLGSDHLPVRYRIATGGTQ